MVDDQRGAGVDVVTGAHQLEMGIDFLQRQLVFQLGADFPIELFDSLGQDVAGAFRAGQRLAGAMVQLP